MKWTALTIFALLSIIIVNGCSKIEKQGNLEGTSVVNEAKNLEKATFAGGCFWCMEPPFEKLDGVKDVIAGYAGGREENPTYVQVSSGTTGHRESIRVIYDPTRVSYEQLLDVFWQQINPTDVEGQFVDRGFQYTSAIFYHDAEQKRLAEKSKKTLAASGRFQTPIVTPIIAFT